MKKSTMSALVFFIPLIVIGSLILVGFAASANQHTDCRYTQMSIDFHNQSLTISHGDYNISVSVSALRSVSVNKILINPSNVTSVSLNGAAVTIANPLNYHLNSGDYLQVNFLMPCIEASPNHTAITIFTQQGMYYQEIDFTQTPSEPI
jgi:hypothetical protein